MNVLSLFSGAEGIGLGLESAGMSVVGQCEIEPAAVKILAHHWPDVPRWDDVRKVTVQDVLSRVGRPDVVVGGFPCQDLSVAGQRAGMAGERSGLYRELLRLTRGLNPDWLVVENVPGLLSASADPDGGAPAGSAMGLFLGDLTGFFPPIPDGGWRNSGVIVGPLGSAAWRVLDARYFGVAQRRRRVFVVFHPRDRRAPGAVLLEPQGLQRDLAPRIASWQRTSDMAGAGVEGDGSVARTLLAKGNDSMAHDLDTYVPLPTDWVSPTLLAGGNSTGGTRPPGTTVDTAESLVPVAVESGQGYWLDTQVAGPLRHRDYKDGPSTLLGPTHALTAEGADASEDGMGRGTPLVPVTAATLTAGTSKPGVSAPGRRQEDDVNLVPYGLKFVSTDYSCTRDGIGALTTTHGQPGTVAVPLDLRNACRSSGNGAGTQGDGIGREGDPAGTVTGQSIARPAVAFRENMSGELSVDEPDAPNSSLRAGKVHKVNVGTSVRRLTPLECERLMGWPDNHTAPAGSDSARYKACGNGVVANVAEWIGGRILDYVDGVAA